MPNLYSNIDIWLNYIGKFNSNYINLTLNRVSEVAKKINILTPSKFIFIVGGTNGKGTTCCVLENILISSGFKVGLYSSPHILHYKERIRVNGNILDDYIYINTFNEINNKKNNIELTYFEFTTLVALKIFKDLNLDIVILEVGLGGRLDATNIINPNVSVITNIELDHTRILGLNTNKIGLEKIGISRKNKPLIFGSYNLSEKNFNLINKNKIKLYKKGIKWNIFKNKNYWNWYNKKIEFIKIPYINIPSENVATAIASINYSSLNINSKYIYDGIKKSFLPCRFQIVNKKPLVIIDAAHNPHASLFLYKRLIKIKKDRNIRAVIGMLIDKDIKNTIKNLKNIIYKWYCGSLYVYRGASSNEFKKYLKYNYLLFNNIELAYDQAINDSYISDIIIVFGSFYTAGAILKKLNIKI